jgi:hypothetical protein
MALLHSAPTAEHMILKPRIVNKHILYIKQFIITHQRETGFFYAPSWMLEETMTTPNNKQIPGIGSFFFGTGVL